MNKFLIGLLAFLAIGSPRLWAAEDANIDTDDPVAQTDQSKWLEALQKKYSWSDAQMKSLKDAGLSYPGMVKASELALKSGKPLADILKMRTEQKMGWGKIAKELGVPPGDLGKSVAEIRHEIRDERRSDRADRREDRAEKRADKAADRVARDQERQEHRKK